MNLGANDRRKDGFLSVDVCPPADVIMDLSKPWTELGDDSVDEVFAHDIFEHLPNKRQTINELFRVLKNGGTADICVPTAPGVGSWCDPTHCSVWTAGDFEYFEKGNFARERFRESSYYGVKADFKIVSWNWQNYTNKFGEEIKKFRIVLQAIK